MDTVAAILIIYRIAAVKPKDSGTRRSVHSLPHWHSHSHSHSHSRLHKRQDNSTSARGNSTCFLILDNFIDDTAAANASAVMTDLVPSPYKIADGT